MTIAVTAERDEAQDAAPPPTRRPRYPLTGASRWALGIALIILSGLLLLWSQRKPIANRYVADLLAERGIVAQYRIADLGFNRQRLTNVVIGDPARPDLVADWIDLNTVVGLSGARVTGIRAGAVRVRGIWRAGKLSLGAIDRLLPAPSGKPFSLPAIDLDIADGRMRLESPMGVIGIKLSGRGRLDTGFVGRATAVSERLAVSGCAAQRVAASGAVRITDRQPGFAGPIRLASLVCGETVMKALRADIDALLDERIDRWNGRAAVSIGSVRDALGDVDSVAGSVAFSGSAAKTAGTIDLRSGSFRTAEASGRALAIAGKYTAGKSGLTLQGTASATRAALSPRWQALLGRFGGAAAGTPIAPLMVRLASSAQAAGRSFGASSDIDVRVADGTTRIRLARATAKAASGGELSLTGRGDPGGDESGVLVDAAGVRLNGALSVAGGGLPEATVQLAQAAAGAPITGSAFMRPYAAGGARLALAAIDFTASPGGATRITTRATLSGPLGSGQIDGATLPIAADWDGRGRLRANSACAPLTFDRLAIAGLVLGNSRLILCPTGPALLLLEGNRLGGGGRIAAPRLAGRLGGAPITLAATDARFGIAARDFAVSMLTLRLGNPDRVSLLDIAALDGKWAGSGAAGRFSGGAGQIGRVPLLMSGSNGEWRLDAGKLAIRGALSVADADPEPRFYPLNGSDVAFTLADSAITATASLVHPETGSRITDVRLAHDLDSGIGHADLAVPGISFGDAFQPNQLTRFTYGVIADVKGKVSGNGQIRWTKDGVTSDGIFRTAGTDLAAAFGPVTGLSGEIRFTDLLNLESAPGQVATIASINPGIPVTQGLLRYQTLPGARVAVEGARWPFAGGELVLEPSVLDFTDSGDRRLTFRVEGVNAAQFLQQFDFKNLDATGTFDGVLPMIFDDQGGRIADGRLTVRESGGTIAYVGEISQKDLGFWANIAFQALKSLRYKSLEIGMDGPLAGEMITDVRFAGISQGVGAKSNFVIRRLQRLPFVFNVRIKAPFRQLIDSAQSYYDPRRLIERNLPALIRAQNESLQPKPPTKPDNPVQPPASEPMP